MKTQKTIKCPRCSKDMARTSEGGLKPYWCCKNCDNIILDTDKILRIKK